VRENARLHQLRGGVMLTVARRRGFIQTAEPGERCFQRGLRGVGVGVIADAASAGDFALP
jgi:hypothetical protein